MLDVSSSTKGMLVPRMTETEKNAVSSPANGLLIYQTNGVTGPSGTNGSLNAWGLAGNAGTTPGIDFIGTFF